MFTLVLVLIIIVSFLLGIVILVQNSKGGGLSSGFAASNQIMGVRKTTDFLEKLTWGFAITMLVLAVVGNFVIPRNTGTNNASIIEDQIQNVPAAQAPAAQPAAQPAQPAAQPAPAGDQPSATPAP
ncbi:MAG: preprotein translocase subunit SecG [Bacteroidia bacterium]|jgi:preprotein translocase subunit SecG|nr:preprotein translocase subunit SecG [Bacteroidia bacterium]MBP7245152.1 preprotein translocase subunit SecG [Bacteroidia bacterium]